MIVLILIALVFILMLAEWFTHDRKEFQKHLDNMDLDK